MTKQNLIRVLSGLMFLIFFCPFFQMCSDDGLLHKISDDKTEKTEREKDTIVLNAFELSVFNISDNDNFWWPQLLFTGIIMASLGIFVMSLRGHYFGLRFLCYFNIFVCLAYLVLMLYARVLDDLRQIKYGYYLFMLNSIAIIALSKRIDPYGEE